MLRRSRRTAFGVARSGRRSAWILISSSTNLTFFASTSGASFASAIGQKAGTLRSGGTGGREDLGVGMLRHGSPFSNTGSEPPINQHSGPRRTETDPYQFAEKRILGGWR